MTAATATRPSTLAADLLLVRLLVPTARPTPPSRLRADLAKFFRSPLTEERWRSAVAELTAAGLAEDRPLRLSDAGRARALEFLGLSELPPRVNWKAIKARYLVPKALGLAPDDAEGLKRAGHVNGLSALLLRERFDLNTGDKATLPRALEALACRELGYPQAASLDEVKLLVLNRLAGSSERMGWKQLQKQLPRIVLGAGRSGIGPLQEVLLQRLGGDGPEPPRPQPESLPFDPQEFANTVKAAARDCPSGRFGDNKVFISHLWRHLRGEPSFPPMDLVEFKQQLVEANRDGLLRLSRADPVEAMNPDDVRESEAKYLNAEFHFVLVERGQP